MGHETWIIRFHGPWNCHGSWKLTRPEFTVFPVKPWTPEKISGIRDPGNEVVSQGLSAIAAQGSSLATHATHLDACGFHQPWSPSVPSGFLLSTSSSSTPPVPVATPTNVLTGMLLSLVISSLVPVFSSASLPSIASCSTTVYRLLTCLFFFSGGKSIFSLAFL